MAVYHTFPNQELRGFFQRDAQFAAEDEAELESEKERLGSQYVLAKELLDEQNKKYDFSAELIECNDISHRFRANGHDSEGDSILVGIVTDSFKAPKRLVFFEKLYLAIPMNFPKTFFGGIECIPYDLPGSGGQFKSASFWGTMELDKSGILMFSGKYQPQGMNRRLGGVWKLESQKR